jgi:hypothetical protein
MQQDSLTIKPIILKELIFVMFFLLSLLDNNQSKAQCCDFTVLMQDTYGDGWNGGNLQVLVNSTSMGVFSAQLYGSSATFQACTGDIIELVYSSGDYENENSYQLFNQNWNLLFNDGTNPTTGQVFDTIANCNAFFIPGNHPCTALPLDTINCVWTDNSNMPGSGINAGCANYTGNDVWYSMIVPPSGNISLQTDSGTINDTGIAAWISDS